MIGICDKCGNHVMRYGGIEEMNVPCGKCGGYLFWCLHYGFRNIPDHYVLWDCENRKCLSPDMCDSTGVNRDLSQESLTRVRERGILNID